MSGNHGSPPRGLDAARSRLHQGRFGRMFRNLAPATFGATEKENQANLAELADKMSAGDSPSNGPDPEESGIPALYTYLGQFIDHDITFDPVSSLTKFNDPDGLDDFRTPGLNLDNVYGRGPADQPYMYDDNKFVLGEPVTIGQITAHDLPRVAVISAGIVTRTRAIIGDPRNDENSIVSQFQGLFLKFHNRMVDDNPKLAFEQVQQLVTYHYQYMIVHDFLPKIVTSSVLESLKEHGQYSKSKLKYYEWKNDPYMPVEFSVAAYRLGHSMIRPGYQTNSSVKGPLPIFPPAGKTGGLAGFQPIGPDQVIDWGRFIDVDTRPDDGSDDDKSRRLQFAYRIDTSLVGPLKSLPNSVVGSDVSVAEHALGYRNLLRGWRLELPSGQAVARTMNETPLPDSKINIMKAEDGATPEKGQNITEIGKGVFNGNCPLWVYILAEAMEHKTKARQIPPAAGVESNIPPPVRGGSHTPQLGPVGGRIVAEVFLGLLFGDKTSYLNVDPKWHPSTGKDFRLKDFVLYALGQGASLVSRAKET